MNNKQRKIQLKEDKLKKILDLNKSLEEVDIKIFKQFLQECQLIKEEDNINKDSLMNLNIANETLENAKKTVNHLIERNNEEYLNILKVIAIKLAKQKLMRTEQERIKLAEQLREKYPIKRCASIGLLFFLLCLFYHLLGLTIEDLLRDLELMYFNYNEQKPQLKNIEINLSSLDDQFK